MGTAHQTSFWNLIDGRIAFFDDLKRTVFWQFVFGLIDIFFAQVLHADDRITLSVFGPQ